MSLVRCAAAAVLLLAAQAAAAQAPCCSITAIDARSGEVAAKVDASGAVFRFKADAKILDTLRVGQRIYANLPNKQVSLDGKSACCAIVSGPAPAAAAPAPVPGPAAGRKGGASSLSLSVYPPAGSLTSNPDDNPYTSSPKVGDGTQIVLTAQYAKPPALHTSFTFTAIRMPGKELHHLPSKGNQAWFTPSKGGDYNFRVVAKAGPYEESAWSYGYHVRPGQSATVSLSAEPPVKALPGQFAIRGTVSLPPRLAAAADQTRLWFGYSRRFVNQGEQRVQHWQGPFNAQAGLKPGAPLGASTAVWHPNPPLVPGLYQLKVYAQSFDDHVLVAEGTGLGNGKQPDLYFGYFYAVLFPPAPCPPAAPAPNPKQAFGWLTPITTQNTTEPVAAPQSGADCAVAGHGIEAITNHPQLRVRKINVSCMNCHAQLMYGTQGRDWLCAVLTPRSVIFPHRDAPESETMLYNLLADWKSRGCPD